ncbi:MAG: hypothetical protein MUD14_15590 [Hydrococcus sp. Prado102]|jgi:hypothetical protein|nr:hypothetical protein [Hydrococcus sp. Prado102]
MTKFTQNLAIAIGINQYQNGIASLNTAKPNSEDLFEALQDGVRNRKGRRKKQT